MRKLLENKGVQLLITFAIVVIWAETFVSSKVLITSGLMPADIFFFRFILAYACMVALSHERMWSDSVRDELLLVLLGVMGGSLYFLTENMALKYSTASNVAILVGTTPLMTALLLACFYKEERMSWTQILGSLVSFAGLILVVLNGQYILHLNPLGDALALGASVTWGFYSLFLKMVADKYDASFITRKVFGYGLLTILPIFLFRPLDMDTALLGQPVVWGNLVYLGLVASLVCFVVWNWCLPRLGTVRTTNMIYCQPFFTMLISSIWLGERITWMAVAGTAILIGGMMLANSNNIPGHGEEH